MTRSAPIVGYVSKAGRLRAYRLKAQTKDKRRALLQSFGAKPVEFWVDTDKLCAPPPNPRQCGECDGWDGQHYPDCCFG